MNLLTKLDLLRRILQWRVVWDKRDTHYTPPQTDNPKFMDPRAAARLIRDGDMIAISGLGGNQHATIMYWAIREMFDETGQPRDLTVLSIGGQGGRGKVPGTIDELGVEGLCTRFISGHMETFKNMLTLGEAGKLELQCYPQGTLAQLIQAQVEGHDDVLVPTGVGTFMDPSIGGRGTPLAGENAQQWVEREGDLLRFRMPLIDVAIFNAPAADGAGNIYMKDTAMIAESAEIALAARKNGGVVIANVGKMVDEGYDEVFLPAPAIDAIVVYPKTGQTLARSHLKPWRLLTLDSDIPMDEGVRQIRFINQTIGVTPKRNEVEMALGRLAASVFAEFVPRGVLVNIGTGLPEEACREIYEGGLLEHLTFFTESGVVGGVPGPGVFFGAAACPEEIVSSVAIFERAHRELDVTILGILQVDSKGNVNVSKRGEGPLNYVGPGGFIDFSTSAKTVIFVGNWMARGDVRIQGDRVHVAAHGAPKFIEAVDEITFSGAEALKAGRQILYVTTVGVFRLTEGGLTLIKVMPGIDIQKDIVDFAPAKIVVPEDGSVETVDAAIVTGQGYALSM